MWQMLPGYGWGPYNSPIKVYQATPRKTGKNILLLEFFNARYAKGVQGFALDLRILKRTDECIVSELLYGVNGPDDRIAIIQKASFPLLYSMIGDHLPEPSANEDIQSYLERITAKW
jgi:hypothetical protein